MTSHNSPNDRLATTFSSSTSKSLIPDSMRAQLATLVSDGSRAVQPGDIRIHAARQPDYLIEGSFLVHATIAGRKTWYALHDGEMGPLAREIGAAPGGELPHEQLAELLQFETERAAREYVIDFIDVYLSWRYLHTAERQRAVLAPYEEVASRLEWFTPLIDDEREEVRRILKKTPISVSRPDDESFAVELILLQAGCLTSASVAVFRQSSAARSLYNLHALGEVRVRLGRTLYEGLPANCRVRDGDTPGFPARDADEPHGTWVDVPEDDARFIQRDLMRHLRETQQWGRRPVIFGDVPRMRRQRLAFYGLDLIELGEPGAKKPSRVLWKPGSATPLDGRSDPIHAINERMTTDRKPVIQSRQDAIDYVRFFCENVNGPESAFGFVESGSDPRLNPASLSAEERPIEDVLAEIKPAIVTVKGTGQFEVRACILYGGVLFKATFEVTGEGIIQMTDDKPLAGPKADAPAPEQSATTPLPCQLVPAIVPGAGERVIHAAAWCESKHRADRESAMPAVEEDAVFLHRMQPGSLGTHTFRRCRFRGMVDLTATTCNGLLTFEDCVFESGLSLSQARIGGPVTLIRCVIVPGPDDAVANFSNSVVGSLTLQELCTAGVVRGESMRTDGSVWIESAIIGGGVEISGVSAGEIDISGLYAPAGVNAMNAVVSQHINVQTLECANGGANLYGASIKYNYLLMSGLNVAGPVDATFLRVGTGVFVAGDPETPNRIGDTLDLRGVIAPQIIRIQSTDVVGDINLRFARTGAIRIDAERETRAAALLMDGLECQGDSELEGLSLSGDGYISAKGATFRDRLSVSSETGTATIPGFLDLTGSDIGELSVSVKSFEIGKNQVVTTDLVEKRGIILKQAKLEKFTAFHDGVRYPAPIDLRYAEIKWWEFMRMDQQKAVASDEVEDYERLMQGDPYKHPLTYKSIEQVLVNRGDEVGADVIHWQQRIAQWQRARTNPSRWARFIAGVRFYLWDIPTAHRWAPWHLVFGIVLPLLILSTYTFSVPANIEPSNMGLVSHHELREGQPPEHWGIGSGAWMAIRFQVPIAEFTARDLWQPNSVSPFRFARWEIRGMSAEDYANIVRGLHWFIWPMILITGSRKYFRKAAGGGGE